MPALETEGEPFVIDPHQIEQRRVEVMHVHGIFGNRVTQFVGFSVAETTLGSSTRYPNGEGIFVMIAPDLGLFPFTVGSLTERLSSELGRPNYLR